MSNVLGTVVPVKEVIRLAHARGIPVLVDGSQSAVHMPVDVRDLDCDFYVFTGHKIYGPTGIGVLYAKKAHLDAMRPYQGGGDMIELRHTRPHHLRQAAAQVRGRHAAHRAGDRARRGARLYEQRRPRAHRAPRGGAARLCACAARPSCNWLKIYGRRPARAASSRSPWTGCIRTTSRPSSTARAWRCGPGTIARSR